MNSEENATRFIYLEKGSLEEFLDALEKRGIKKAYQTSMSLKKNLELVQNGQKVICDVLNTTITYILTAIDRNDNIILKFKTPIFYGLEFDLDKSLGKIEENQNKLNEELKKKGVEIEDGILTIE